MGLIRKLYYTLGSLASHPLNRDAKWRAAWNFCVAQAAVRMIPGDICVPFPNQTRLLIPPQMKGAAHFIVPGLCEFDEMCFVMHFLRTGELFADVGANVGAYTVLASGAVGAVTTAFEPSPSTCRYLEQNARLNDLGNRVTVHNAAVGAKEGRLHLTNSLGTENYICPDGSGVEGVSVEVKTLDKVFLNSTPILIKVDVEGFEAEVFAGAHRLLHNAALEAMIVERTGIGSRYGHDENALHRQIQSAGFIPCHYTAMTRKLIKVDPDAQGNIIYVRQFDLACERVRKAPAFSFNGQTI